MPVLPSSLATQEIAVSPNVSVTITVVAYFALNGWVAWLWFRRRL